MVKFLATSGLFFWLSGFGVEGKEVPSPQAHLPVPCLVQRLDQFFIHFDHSFIPATNTY